jgi:hypothetical protein
MRRALTLALAALSLTGLAAGAQTAWVPMEQLEADPADPAVVRFFVDIREPGTYQVHLLVRGEAEKEIRLELALQPEAGGSPQSVRFSFTGRGCG